MEHYGASTYGGSCSQEWDRRVSFLKSSDSQGSITEQKAASRKKTKTLNVSHSQLSSWPSYAAGHMILQTRIPCSPLELQRSSKDRLGLSISKPRYLEYLENHLQKELQSLDLTKGKVQELKLQPYREVFECFMEEFKTYKPLLASIKNEYELTIAHLQEKVRSLEAVNAILVTASDQCTRQILDFQEQEKVEITLLKKERLQLLQLIDKMKEDKCSLETQVYKMRKTVAEEYLRYLNECDARKLLLLDLNEMYRQKEEMKLAQVQDGDKGEDSVKLSLALKTARRDLTKAQVELNTMRANYGDVVPRRDFESQEEKYNELFEKAMALQQDYDVLEDEYSTLLDIHKQISEERDQYYTELLNVQRSSTPRPDWDKCAAVIAGGPERWTALSEGKTSDQLVDVLLEDLGAGLLRERDSFPALGKGEKVPVFLRCDGQVKNKKLTKKEVVALLREIWREKVIADQQKGKQSSLPEFFLAFFQRKYGDMPAFDWTYSIYENIKLYRSNEAMALFYDIVTGNMDEGVYHSYLQQLSTLVKELTTLDALNTGQLTSEQFALAARGAFPLKTDEQIQELTEAAGYKADNPEDLVVYKALFLEDDEGKTEPLIGKIKSQYASEKQAYLRELQTELGNMQEVRVEELKAAFYTIDPGLAEQTLDAYICQAFQVPKEVLDPAASVPVETVIQRLMAGDVKRQGTLQAEPKLPPPPAEETEDPVNS